MKSVDRITGLFVLLLFAGTPVFSQEKPVTAADAVIEIYYAPDSSSGLKKSDFRNASAQPFTCFDSLTRGSADAILLAWTNDRTADSICFSVTRQDYSYRSVIRSTRYIPVKITTVYATGPDVIRTEYFLNTGEKRTFSFSSRRTDRSYFNGLLTTYTEKSCLAESPVEEQHCYFSRGGLDSAFVLFNGQKTGFEYRFNGIGEEVYCHANGERKEIVLSNDRLERQDDFFNHPCAMQAFYKLYPLLKEQQLPIRKSSVLHLFVQQEQQELQFQELNPK